MPWIAAIVVVAAGASAGAYYYADDIRMMFGGNPPEQAADDPEPSASAPVQTAAVEPKPDPEPVTAESAPEPTDEAPADTAEQPAPAPASEETAEAATDDATEPESSAPASATADDAPGTDEAPTDPAAEARADADSPAAEAAAPDKDTPDTSAPDTSDVAVPYAPASDATAADTADAPSFPPPEVDLLRVDPDGSVVIAGRTEPRATVFATFGGTEIARMTAGADGKFAGFGDVGAVTEATVIQIFAELNGLRVQADDEFWVLPTVADTDTDTAPADDTPAQTAEAETTEPATGNTEATGAVAEPEPVADAVPEAEAVADATPEQGETTTAPVADGAAAAPEPAVETAAISTEATVETAETKPVPTSPEPEAASESAQTDNAQTESAQETQDVATATPDVKDSPAEGPAASVAQDSRIAESVARPQVVTSAGDTSPSVDRASDPARPPVPARPLTVLRTSRDGVDVVQGGSPTPPTALERIELATISYTEGGQVYLTGSSAGDSTVRVYLDNVAVADIPADTAGRWSGALEGVAPGIYTLRLDEIGAGGQVTSRLETPFKRENPERLVPPAGETAPDGAPGQPRAVTVQQGDTLWAISRDRYGDGVLYVRVFEANQDKIRDPDLIYPGQVFSLPE